MSFVKAALSAFFRAKDARGSIRPIRLFSSYFQTSEIGMEVLVL